MPVDPKLQELLDRWEDLQEQGQDVSAQELCREHPELLEELKRRIKALKAMAWLLESDHSTGGDRVVTSHDGLRAPPSTLGRYRLDELVGTGGFGQVWKGHDPELQRVVAIKVPRLDRLSPEQADTFLEEARKVARLRHPGIVPVHDVGKDGDYCFIVSDFVEGGNLADRLKLGRPDWQETARLIADVAEILDHAHKQGFVHRDIKPANILLDNNGQPYLTDFGIAATKEELHAVRSPSIGTLAYMSPEQVLGQPVDARADIYSLGVVLFEMLTGERPYSAENAGALREQILSSVPLQMRLKAVPEELARICLKCLEKSPAERYSAASSLAAGLRDLSERPHPKKRPHRSTRVRVALLLVGLVVLGSAGYWVMQRGQQSAEMPPMTPDDVPPPPRSGNPQQWIAKGNMMFQLHKFQEAASAFTEAIQHAPESAEAYHRRGVCYYDLGEIARAITDFNRAVELDQTNAEVRKHRALAFLRLKQFDKGLADAEEGLRLDPSHATSYTSVMAMAYSGRASEHNDAHRWNEAIADLDELLRLEPHNAKGYQERGVVRYNVQDFDRAIADLTKAIDINPGDATSYLYRSYAHRAKGQVDEAKADLKKAQSFEIRAKRDRGT